MGGRDPNEAHRVATPLELLFDLTFAISFGFAASQFAHALAKGHFSIALIGFGLASFCICWAWVNFSWFSSAYDTDDWIFRVMTMTQMIGVLILAIGVPRLFSSLEMGDGHVDAGMMVFGYVVMRVALVLQWSRAARQNPERRHACMAYAGVTVLAQVGWCTWTLIAMPVAASVVVFLCLLILELAGPVLAERQDGGTPWHAHHIVERYMSFAIIALGEGIVGTVASLSAVVQTQGWTLDTILVCVAGVGLTFGLWWIYLMLPSAPVLHAHRERAFVWSSLQLLMVCAIVSTGAGLQVAAYYVQHTVHISAFATLLTVAIPVASYVVLIYGLYYYLVQGFDSFHTWLLALTAAVIAMAITAAVPSVSMPACLSIIMLAPVVTVVGYEWKGHRHQAEAIRPD
jgi:low temperature requirement protein LtrA